MEDALKQNLRMEDDLNKKIMEENQKKWTKIKKNGR